MGFCAMASKDGNQLYLIAGYDDGGQKRKLERLNLETLEWTRLADLSQNRSRPGCAHFGNGIVIAGGWGIINGPVA